VIFPLEFKMPRLAHFIARVVQFKIQALNSGNPAQAPGQVPLLVGRAYEDTGDIGQRIQLRSASFIFFDDPYLIPLEFIAAEQIRVVGTMLTLT